MASGDRRSHTRRLIKSNSQSSIDLTHLIDSFARRSFGESECGGLSLEIIGPDLPVGLGWAFFVEQLVGLAWGRGPGQLHTGSVARRVDHDQGVGFVLYLNDVSVARADGRAPVVGGLHGGKIKAQSQVLGR